MKTRSKKRKRIIAAGSTVAYFSNGKADLTKQGAEWWDRGFPAKNEVTGAIQELATELHHSIEVTYKGRSISKIYPSMERDPPVPRRVRELSTRTLNWLKDRSANIQYHSDNRAYLEFRSEPDRLWLQVNSRKYGDNRARNLKDAILQARKLELERVQRGPLDPDKKYPRYPHGKAKIKKVITEFEQGKLRSSSGKKVTSLRQARAIALSEQRRKEHISTRDCSCAHPVRHPSARRDVKRSRRVAKVCPIGTEVQTLVLSKKYFTEKQAANWARQHNFRVSKVDETANNYRFRQHPPSNFVEGDFRTIRLRSGVEAVIGCPK